MIRHIITEIINNGIKSNDNIILKCQGLKNVTFNLSQPYFFSVLPLFSFFFKGERGYRVVIHIPAHTLYDSCEQFQATRVQNWEF